MLNAPGHLKTIASVDQYLDLLYASRLSPEHKLVGTFVTRTCAFNRKEYANFSAITNYAIGRQIQLGPDRVQELLDDLEKYGWLFDTGQRIGARKIFVLTFSLLPMGEPKT